MHRLLDKRVCVSAGAIAAVLGATTLTFGAAHAQTPQTTTQDPVVTRAEVGVEEIVVRARLRAESIQETPVSVTAITNAQLENQASVDIQDIEGLAPNTIIDNVNAGPSAAAISIRGISFEDIEKSFDPTVGVIVDGVFLGTNTGQLIDFFDFQSVEILRGPQGTLFGRNTIGGVVNIRRSDPTGEWGLRSSATLGNFGRREYRVVANAPIIEDKLAVKGFYFRQQSEGFVDNVTLDQREPESTVQNYGATVLFTPADWARWKFTYEQTREDSETAQGSLSQPGIDLVCLGAALPPGSFPPGFFPPAQECGRNNDEDLYTTFTNIRGPIEADTDAIASELNLEFGPLDFTYILGWRQVDESVRQDFDAVSVDFFDTLRLQDYDQFSHELRLAGDITDRINFVTGLFYFDSDYSLDQTSNFGPALQTLGGTPPQSGQLVEHSNQSFAVFGDVDVQLTERLKISGGGRWTRDEKSIVNEFGIILPGLGFISTSPIPGTAIVPGFQVQAEDSWSEFTPRASVDYALRDDNLVYFSYAKGFRSGGFNGRAATAASAAIPFEPETVRSYEVGSKNGFFDNRLVLNMAAFWSNYDNKQEEIVRATPPGSPNPQETIVANASTARIRGIELDFTARPVPSLLINGALGFLDAEFTDFPLLVVGTGVVDISSRNLRRAPEFTASIGGEYTRPVPLGELQIAAVYRYLGEYDTTINGDPLDITRNDPRGRTDKQNLIDARIDYRILQDDSMVRIGFFGRNLLDDRGLNAALPVAGLFTFGSARPPRTWGVELGFEF